MMQPRVTAPQGNKLRRRFSPQVRVLLQSLLLRAGCEQCVLQADAQSMEERFRKWQKAVNRSLELDDLVDET